MEDDKLDVEEVVAEMRGLLGEQAQQIAMLRAALAKAKRPTAAAGPTGEPPIPDPDPVR